MQVGDTVYFKYNERYIKYIIKKIIDNDELIVFTQKTHIYNWLHKSDVITVDDFNRYHRYEDVLE